ncbi:MAG TPA: extracellular solute-binding protein [Candidatus Acidoferrales bacterium]|nr:extracellular solute-binding protein [Candidatus Acidoferrales bacterium]
MTVESDGKRTCRERRAMKVLKSRSIGATAVIAAAAIASLAHADADWREEWHRTVRAGKQEGKVVVFTFPGLERVFQEFERSFPDIKVTVAALRGSERITRILTERRAGKYLVDFLIGGAGSAQSGLLKAGVLDPIKPLLMLPEVLDSSRWWRGRHIYADEERKYIFSFGGSPVHYFHYNTTLVNPSEFKSYWDLLHPRWKGKIVVAEPLSSGTFEILQFLYHHDELGPEFIRRFLTEMDLGVTRDSRQFVDWLAQGKYALGGLQNADRIELWAAKKQGLPVDTFELARFKEGGLIGPGGSNIALINRAPHPNAAVVFVNWLLSREGQIAYQKFAQGGRNSLRVDIPKDDLPPHSRIKPELKYAIADETKDPEAFRRFVHDVWRKK